jgi:hypothetical protein
MDPLHLTIGRQLAQVTANRVFRCIPPLRKVDDGDESIADQRVDNEGFALRREHQISVQQSARFCLLLHESARIVARMNNPLLILIAGPYRSGTNDEPERLQANLEFLESAAWPIFEAGHIPMIGEWVALPVGDPTSLTVLTPTAERLLQHCDAVLRLPGASTGADNDVRIARERGIPVYHSVDEIPRANAAA